MTIDTAKAKRALTTLQEEKRAQLDRLQLAAQAKQKLEQTIAQRTHSLLCRERVLNGLTKNKAPLHTASLRQQSA